MAEQLWKDYSIDICNYFKRRTGNRALSCDLMQDTFKKVLDHKDQLDNIENHQAWMYRIARNLLIDHSRKKKETTLPDVTILEENADARLEESEIGDIAECLYQLIQEYDEDEQGLLIKVFRKSLSQKEVAHYLDIPYSTYKSRVQKVRNQIIEEFKKRCCHLKYDHNGHIIGCTPVN